MRKSPSFYIIAIALLFITKFILLLYVFDPYIEIFADENSYIYSALDINKYQVLTNDRSGEMYSGKTTVQPTLSLMPGYPIYLSALLDIFHNNIVKIRFINIAWYLLLMLYFYLYCGLFKLRKVAVFLGLLTFVFYPGLTFNVARLLTENIFCLIMYAGMYHLLVSIAIDTSQATKLIHYFAGVLLFVLSIFVRPHSLPIFIIAIVCINLICNESNKSVTKRFILAGSILLLFMGPWWIRNYIVSGKFIFLSLSGESPKIWGAIPYFLDMQSNAGNSFKEISEMSYSANPVVYLKWRLFGFFQYMWGDIWDEYLVHKFNIFRPFLLLQYLIIVPVITLTPFIVRYSKTIPIILLSAIPILFTLMNLYYHGLPRYVWPSIPFVILIFSYIIDTIAGKINPVKINLLQTPSINWKVDSKRFPLRGIIVKTGRISFLFLSVLFSIVLLYSIYIFPWKIEKEMSEYRLGINDNVSINQVLKSWNIVQEKTIQSNEIIFNNYKYKIKNNCYKGIMNAPMSFDINIDPTSNNKENIITEVTINGHGGYPFDYMTIYWKNNNDNQFAENRCYNFPVNVFEKSQNFFIDGDVTKLFIVPAKFRGGTYCLSNISFKKYKK